MKLQPLQSNILCSVHEGRETEIIIPDKSEGVQPYAKVLSVGPDVKKVQLGDRVLFHPSNAIFADEIDGEKIVIVSEAAVFARYVDFDPIPNN